MNAYPIMFGAAMLSPAIVGVYRLWERFEDLSRLNAAAKHRAYVLLSTERRALRIAQRYKSKQERNSSPVDGFFKSCSKCRCTGLPVVDGLCTPCSVEFGAYDIDDSKKSKKLLTSEVGYAG
jgi:hypothetical protein